MTLLQGSSYIWPAARNLQPAARSPQNSQFAFCIHLMKPQEISLIV